jgi:hypothetical protein
MGGVTVNKINIRWRGRGPALGASAGVVLAVLAGTALPGAAGAATSRPAAKSASVGPAVTVSADPLGVDVAPWDTLFSNPATLGTVESYLRAAGVTELHYGGGGTADQFDEQTNTVVNDCGADPTVADFTASCAKTESLDFAHFSADARSLGAQTFATVNYGTGDPAMAANWVTQSLQSGQQVAQWSIGNESYGCWEADDWLLGAPVDDTAYAPDYHAGCPMVYEPTAAAGMTDMADSYAQNALPYMQQMRNADPSIKIGVPWAFDYHVGGASVADNNIWNDTILGEDGSYISFVEAHWYPFSFGGDMGADGNKTAQQVIQSVTTIPADYNSIRQTLSKYDPSATVTVGETGVSYLATNTPCTPTGALFSAGDALEWLAAGAQTVNWWPLETGANNGSSCTVPEEGMFTGNGTPDTAYTGYLLASELAQSNARLSPMTVPNLSNPSDTVDTFGFQSVLPDGQTVVALFNANTASAQTVSVGSSLTGSVATQTYSAGHQNGSDSLITDGTTTAGAVAGGITLPAQSIVILKSQLPSKVTLGASATLVKAGTKVQLRGQVTLNGAAAPARIAVKIYRRAAGSSVNLATLTATTTAGGAFAVTDLPAKYGHYNYVVSYGGTSLYVAASASIPVRVIALQPTLKLKFSAGTVKAGRKVTVTATLAGWHNNHTLVIYAQPAGSARKMIARASTNARGQLVVSFTMKKNTTFTVTYGGDWWYGAASARGIVKI